MKKYIFFLALSFACTAVCGQSRYDSLWSDPGVEQRIREGIEKHRKGDARIKLNRKSASLPKNVTVEVKQLTHAFQFGSNIFMLNGYKKPEQNSRYEEVFQSLFNTACVPFYWKTLEPEPGKLRYGVESKEIYRRPPPDVVLDFCEKAGITPKGHTLVWDNVAHSTPEWLPRDTAIISEKISQRIRQLGERYGNRVKTWDVVNELLSYHANAIQMPDDYGAKAFGQFSKSFPATTRGFINETTSIWNNYHREYSPYNQLIENLKCSGAKIDGIGLQFHFFSEALHHDVVAGKSITPQRVFDVLDLYGKHKVPIHISEITIPTLPYNETGLQNQAKMTKNFYRAWFSHEAVEGIIWWNVSDGTAVAGEDKWRGGFLNEDLTPKPSYFVLNELINKEWKTDFTKSTDQSTMAFRGFYGEYAVKITAGKRVIEKKFMIKKGVENELSIDI
ncbi:endo-1,4-beta-xylanase [Dyadobacter aurulentus]|uniref:endo-1,4-beta-xylanase n=1 Tax=Dyadobacter sp. UC 10 TaxID=2605428 RepID=UPI0011F2857F|nr:endo-1,4-beta-xylanase [Dyadobacter sp. UC 10]KAA0992713.1 glycoside hydrolase family 10 [Dyadobacter sp. UC 10]